MSAKSDASNKSPFPSDLCVWERTESPRYLTIREEMLQLFDGDECMAKVLTALKMFHKRRVQDYWDSNGKSDLWISAKIENIAFWTLDTVSPRKIGDCLKELENQGYLKIFRPPGWKQSSAYLLNVGLINDRLKALPVVQEFPGSHRSARMPNGETAGSAQTATEIGTDDSPFGTKDVTFGTDAEHKRNLLSNLSTDLKKQSEPPLSPYAERAEENTEEVPAWNNDGGELVVSALRRQRGIKLTPKQRTLIREKLAMVLIVEGLIDRVASEFCAWATEHHRLGEPQLICQGRWLKCLKGEEELYVSLDTDTPPSVSPTPGLPAVAAPPQTSPELLKALNTLLPKSNGLPPLSARWNEVVKSGPPVVAWKDHTAGDTALRALMADPQFASQSEAVLAKAESLCAAKHEKGAYLTFGWLIKPGKWVELLNGQHDWLLGDAPKKPKANPVDAMMEEQRKRVEEEKRRNQKLDSTGVG